MKGDFSRFTFRKAKHYTGVLMQQGRVQLDADWNEQVAITGHRIESGLRDTAGGHGAPEAAPGFAVYVRKGLEFDGKDDVVVIPSGEGLSLPGRSAFTLEARIELAADSRGGVIVAKSNGDGTRDAPEEYALCITHERALRFVRRSVRGTHLDERLVEERIGDEIIEEIVAAEIVDTNYRWLETDRPLPTGRSIHVAVNYDGESIALFVDGRRAATDADSGDGLETGGPLTIGARQRDGLIGEYFKGVIDEIRLCSPAQSEGDLLHAANRCPQGDVPGTIAHWRFDEARGDQLHNVSGSRYTGYLGGTEPGARPAWIDPQLWLRRGRYYVDGMVCENLNDTPLAEHLVLPYAGELAAGSHHLHLSVWTRFVSAAEDPNLLEVALGGADTTGRAQTVWQVEATDPGVEREADRHEYPSTMRARRQPLGELPENRLYRVEVHSGGLIFGNVRGQGSGPSCAVIEVSEAERRLKLTTHPTVSLAVGQPLELYRIDDEVPGEVVWIGEFDRQQSSITVDRIPDGMSAETGYHLRPLATLKWSRQNGAQVWPVRSVTDNSAIVDDPRHDAAQLEIGQWVEVAPGSEPVPGARSPLVQITQLVEESDETVQLTFAKPPPLAPGESRDNQLIVRAWNHRADQASGGVVLARGAQWLDLEDGIEILFEGDGSLNAGDYWTIPARTRTADIEWPRDRSGPLAQRPDGMDRRRAPLAHVQIQAGRIRVTDERTIFPSLAQTLSRSGGTIRGPLTVDSHVEVRDDVRTSGDIWARTIHGRLEAESVASESLCEGAVTLEKLAPDVGVIPGGNMILGMSRQPPPGYVFTGKSLSSEVANPVWSVLERRLPGIPLGYASINDSVYVLTVDGSLFRLNLWAADQTAFWIPCRPLANPGLHGVSVTGLNGCVHVVGGSDREAGGSTQHAVYDPATDEWSTAAPMLTARAQVGLGVIDRQLYAVGGKGDGLLGGLLLTTRGDNQSYDPIADRWEVRRPMPTPRSGAAVMAAGGLLYVLGGERRRALGLLADRDCDRLEVYSPTRDSWDALPPMKEARSHLGAAFLGGRIHAFGGHLRDTRTTVNEIYDIRSQRWTEGLPLSTPRSGHGVLVSEGRVIAMGGSSPDDEADTVEGCTLFTSFHVYEKSL